MSGNGTIRVSTMSDQTAARRLRLLEGLANGSSGKELPELARTPIAFTNSLPALTELISGGISTGLVGEVYNPDDSAFHSHELRSGFHPSVAIVGASGLIANGRSLELYSHRAEEAAFMRQL